MLKGQNKDTENSTRETLITYKGRHIRTTADYSAENLKSQKALGSERQQLEMKIAIPNKAICHSLNGN